jgi:hypothetical protein
MAVITNAGLTLLATALQTAGAQAAITYVDVVPGCGTLAVAITSGVAITTLSLNAGLPVALAASANLTVTDGVNTLAVQVTGAGAAQNATTIPINSVTPANSYAINVTGVTLTPAVADTALYNGTAAGIRVAANAGVAGANPGESLNNGYFDGTQATGMYLSVGYFGGSTATATPGTGTLVAEDIQYWNHVLNADSASFQLDSTV